MSDKKKKNGGAPEEKNTPETAAPVTPEETEPAADTQPEGEKSQETFTLTKEQMAKMEGLAKLASDTNDKYLRLAAEYDNYRKRTAKEKEGIYDDAKVDTVKALLAVYDNLERGLQQFTEGDPHKQGMEMICKQFTEALSKLGVTEIEATDQPFNPDFHNAVMHVEDETLGENTVTEVFQKGFKLGDRVVRFAMVKVAN
ncbi:MAG: nucleotide exchange factor GrpE [Clostridiales bacterium]|nr:nucleotide exchange factor GrpE [Clostridiales bacterium]